MLRLSFLTLLILAFSACSSMNNPAVRRAACNELKSKIVFNAATSDTRRANIERAEEPLDEKTYDVNNCDHS